ncbi:membrane protein [Streptomyces sp. 1-11]|nr:membrane protein [Streptomyces sp. 1-11]
MGSMLMLGFTGLMGILKIVMMALAAFGLFDAAFRREDAFRAADKQNKVFWLIILGIALVVSYLFSLLSILPIAGVIASIVYIVDVRPALKQVSGGSGWGRRRGGSSSDGPYGPYNGGR